MSIGDWIITLGIMAMIACEVGLVLWAIYLIYIGAITV